MSFRDRASGENATLFCAYKTLDLIFNPLIALYFAVSELSNRHGEVVVFKIPKKDIKYYDSDTVSVLASIAKCDQNFECNYSQSKEDFNEQGYIALFYIK